MLSAADARSPRLLRFTLIVLAAGALVMPALGSGHSGDHPPAPAGLRVVAATTTSVSWSWEPDDTAASYRLYKNGRFVASTTPWEFTLDGLECGLSYVLGVEAVDANGRRSPRASVIAASAPCTPLKVTPPVATPEPTPAQRSRDAGSGVHALSGADDTGRDPRAHDDCPARDDHSSFAAEHLADRRSLRVARGCGSIPRFSAAS